MCDRPPGEREHFFGAAWTVAAVTVLSRVLGLLRDMAIVALGANRATDSFWTAFMIPNLFRRLFGEGALAAAFVPVFTEVSEAEGPDKARLLLANTAGLLALLLAAIVVLLELILLLWLLLAPGAWDRTLLLQLIMIVLPFMFTVCLLALGSAALNCRGRFFYPAFAPVLLNVFLIAAATFVHAVLPGAGWEALFLLSAVVILAGVAQLIGVAWLLKSVDLAVVPCLRPLLPAVRRVAKLALPMMIPLSLLQLSAFFDRFYAWWMTATPGSPRVFWGIARPLEPGVVTCLYAANRLYQFPMGILAISLATAVFPLLSRYASRGDTAGLRDATNRALRLSLFMGIPAGVALILLARPAILLIYRHGRFTPDDVVRVSLILRMYCLGMWAYFCNHILLRAFFAQKDYRTPLRVSCALAATNVLMVALLVFTPLRARAMGLATASTSSINALMLAWILRRRWGHLGLRKVLVSLLRTGAATALLAAAIWAVTEYLTPLTRSWGSTAASAAIVFSGIAAGAATFLLAAMGLRCPELGELGRSLRRGPKAGP
jgi:putative peptidoglycan lipid II flippase